MAKYVKPHEGRSIYDWLKFIGGKVDNVTSAEAVIKTGGNVVALVAVGKKAEGLICRSLQDLRKAQMMQVEGYYVIADYYTENCVKEIDDGVEAPEVVSDTVTAEDDEEE